MTERARCAALLLAAGVSTACGAAPAPPPALAPETPSQPGGAEYQQAPGGMPDSSEKKSAEAPEAELSTVADAERAFQLGASELGESALSSAPDCELMRKALESMERSRGRICDLNGPADPGKRCSRASEQLDEARAKFRRACGS